MAMKFDGQRAAEVVAAIKKTQNQDVLEVFGRIADTLKNFSEDNQNSLTEQLLEGCKNVQVSFNSYVPGTEAIVKEFCSVEEIEEKLKKMDIGEVNAVDAGFATKQIDVDAVC